MRISLFTLLLFGLGLVSCREIGKKGSLTEGTIEYTITYINTSQLRYKKELLPSVMTVKFKDNNTITQIDGFSGTITFSFINNIVEHDHITLVKLLNKKFYYSEPATKGNYPMIFSDMPPLAITLSDEVVRYAGYSCKKATGVFLDSTQLSFEILYTNQISITNPNLNSPFEPIDGVMLKFTTRFNNLQILLAATEIRNIQISPEEFTVPSGYESVNKGTIKEVMRLLQ